MYRDNPDQVCEIVVEHEQADILQQKVKAAVKQIMDPSCDSESASWVALHDDEIQVTQLTGGITNILYLVEQLGTEKKVIVRLYGAGTSAFIDRSAENFVFSQLSILNIGPIFYGRFMNGRVEGYLPATALESAEMGAPELFPHIASAVAQMHGLDFPQLRSTGWLWSKIRNFLSLAGESPLASTMSQHLTWLQQFVEERRCELSAGVGEEGEGQRFGLQEVLCHNDLLSGNILKSNNGPGAGDRAVYLIDYEYAAYNYRAFDLANHFSEHCGFEYDYERTLPSERFMLDFLRAYVAACRGGDSQPSDAFLAGLLESVRWLLLASHLFWGSWALVQARCSSIDFDYAGYAQRRHGAFLAHQPLYAACRGAEGVQADR